MEIFDILNKEHLNLLHNLDPESKPVFGIMSPQHMVEHLLFVLQFSNGKQISELAVPSEFAEQAKKKLIYSDTQISQGIKSPLLPQNDLLPLVFENLEESVKALKEEITQFENHFKENPDSEPVNPILGKLNYKEWKKFHDKHFLHHFKQFKLL